MTLPEFDPASLPPEQIPAALARLSAWQGQLAARLMMPITPLVAPEEPDRMLTPDEAAQMLRRSRLWIYRNAKRLPFVKRISRKSLLCSEAGVRRWLATRKA